MLLLGICPSLLLAAAGDNATRSAAPYIACSCCLQTAEDRTTCTAVPPRTTCRHVAFPAGLKVSPNLLPTQPPLYHPRCAPIAHLLVTCTILPLVIVRLHYTLRNEGGGGSSGGCRHGSRLPLLAGQSEQPVPRVASSAGGRRGFDRSQGPP